MDYELLFPANYIRSIDFKGAPRTVKIVGVKTEILESSKGKKTKPVLSLENTEKKWVLNRTCAECLVAMFGRDTTAWVGKRVTLWPMPYSKSKSGYAIRVKGSPDIKAPLSFSAKIGWSDETFALEVTASKNGAQPTPVNGQPVQTPGQAPAPAAAAPPAPAVDPKTLPIGHPNAEPPADLALPGQAPAPAAAQVDDEFGDDL